MSSGVQLEWVLGGIIVIIGALSSFFLTGLIKVNRKITSHDLLLASFKDIAARIEDIFHHIERTNTRGEQLYGEVRRKIERHEEKEDNQFSDISRRIERLNINVALLLGHPPNGDKENG